MLVLVHRSRSVTAASLAALLGALAASCAGARGGERAREAPAAHARPEPDPSLRLTVREALVANGLERVTVKVAIDRSGKPTLVEFLTPELSPAAALELRRAFNNCIWKPALGPNGEPEEGSITLLFHAK